MIAGVIDAAAIADPAIGVTHSEQVIGVREGDHAGHVHHQPSADVPRVPDRMSSLFAGDRELVVGRHAHDDAARVGVDDHDVVEEETAGPIRGVGDEIGTESHGPAPWPG